jgi:hypothetical protein
VDVIMSYDELPLASERVLTLQGWDTASKGALTMTGRFVRPGINSFDLCVRGTRIRRNIYVHPFDTFDDCMRDLSPIGVQLRPHIGVGP